MLVEYLDMTAEDSRLTDINNVYLLRRTKRLPFKKRSNAEEIAKQHEEFPIAADVVWQFVQDIRQFVDAVWYDPDEAIRRGSFAPPQ